MSTKYPKPLSELISSNHSSVGRLAAEAQAKLGLADHIRAGLPADLAAQMTSAVLDEDGILIVRTTAPEWAARLRFETTQILVLCRQRRPEAQSVKVRVAHPAA